MLSQGFDKNPVFSGCSLAWDLVTIEGSVIQAMHGYEIDEDMGSWQGSQDVTEARNIFLGGTYTRNQHCKFVLEYPKLLHLWLLL